MASAEDNGPELVPCSFKFHHFYTEVGEVKVSCQIIKMLDSYYIWVGDFANNEMNDLSLALTSSYETVPISTKLLGSVADSTSNDMAKRLAKKLGNPVYVSFNIQMDGLSMPAIERKLCHEIGGSIASPVESDANRSDDSRSSALLAGSKVDTSDRPGGSGA